jgi:uncharacterized protein (TIGR00106 family)
MQISVIPLGSVASYSSFVADFQKALTASNLSFTLNDMATIVEGDIAELLAIAAIIHEIPYSKGIRRVLTSISIDDRRDKAVHLGDKVKAVKKRSS